MTKYRWLIRQAALWGVGAVLLRVVVVPAETCPAVDAAELQRAIDAAAAWLEGGQTDDGRFLYGYSSAEGEVSAEYNSTRHAGVVDVLYRAGRVRAGDAGLQYVLGNLVEHGRWTAFALPGEDANVGANALALAALVHRRLATGDRRHDGLARRIARFLVAQQQPDGSILKYWRPATGRPVPGIYGRFSTGEALWALALMHRMFPEDGWHEPARRVSAYLATTRDDVEGDQILEADHWAAYGLAELAPAGLTDAEVAYARRLAGHFGFLIRLESQHEGGALNPIVESGASLGTTGEGAASLWRLAGTDRRLADLRDDLGERTTCLAAILVARQVGPEEPSPPARGAWFAGGYTQMDDQQHAIAALLGALEVLD